MFHELLLRDREDGCATRQPSRGTAGLDPDAYLNSTSQGPTPEYARKGCHIIRARCAPLSPASGFPVSLSQQANREISGQKEFAAKSSRFFEWQSTEYSSGVIPIFGRLNSLVRKSWKLSKESIPCDSSGVTGGRSVPLPQLWRGEPLARRSAAEAGTVRGRLPPAKAAPEVTRP